MAARRRTRASSRRASAGTRSWLVRPPTNRRHQKTAKRVKKRGFSNHAPAVGLGVSGLSVPATHNMRAVLMVAGAGAALAVLYRYRSRLMSTTATALKTRLVVKTADGIGLPCESEGPELAPLRVVAAHGLGSKDPSLKSHADDALRTVLLPALESVQCRAAFYTARGHGASDGWQGQGSQQMTWPHLAEDALAIADAHGPLPKFVAAGNSMGAATMLNLALKHPDRVAALILYRVPTIWEARTARRAELLGSAARLREERGASWPFYETLAGSAESNLPPRNDPCWDALRRRQMPILILAHGEDAVHPIASGAELAEMLGEKATLQVAANEAEASVAFPPLVSAWLKAIDDDVENW